jgi:thermitase
MALGKSLLAVFGMVALFGINASAIEAEEFVIKFKTQKQFNNSYMSLKNFDGLSFWDFNRPGKLAKVKLRNDKDLPAKLKLLSKRSDIEYIVPNFKFHATPISNEPRAGEQWALEKINAVSAWARTLGSAKVIVAVVDTGVDYNHEDLKANMWVNAKEIPDNGIDDDANGFIDDVRGWNFHDNTNDPMDKTSAENPGHGTHCAGIIGAVGNNGIGVSGINQIVSIMPIKFLGADGSGDLFASTKAIDYAIQNGANVISASWGAAVGQSMAQPIVDAIDRARQKGVIFVAAAANDGTNNDARAIFPANTELSNVISVAATDVNDTKPKWSNYGMKLVHVGAPGHEILSTIPNNEYKKLSGTSMATPLVAGLVALLESLDPTLDGPAAKSILQASGTTIDLEVACKCRVDAGKAMDIVAKRRSLALTPESLHLHSSRPILISPK